MKTLLSILALLATFIPTVWAANGMPSVVPINKEGGKHFCTAWSINETRKLWVTAAHCIKNEDGEEMPVPYILGSVVTTVYLDAKLDLAVVHGEIGAKALKIASHSPLVGDGVDIIGHPFGFERVVGHAKVVLLHQFIQGEGIKMILSGLAVGPGNSGGPVLQGGRVVSVLQLGWSSGGFFAGNPWEVMLKALLPFVE